MLCSKKEGKEGGRRKNTDPSLIGEMTEPQKERTCVPRTGENDNTLYSGIPVPDTGWLNDRIYFMHFATFSFQFHLPFSKKFPFLLAMFYTKHKYSIFRTSIMLLMRKCSLPHWEVSCSRRAVSLT